MNVSDLRGADLNLLVVFHALMQERSVTRTAAQLHLSQSAVSAALARLRTLIGDQLFERSRDGMQPTVRALELSAPIAQALGNIAQSLSPEERFDPTASQRTFHIAMSDDIESVLAPWLLRESLESSWRVGFAFHQTNAKQYESRLTEPHIDLVVCATPAELSAPTLRTQTLFGGGYLCVYSAEQLSLSNGLDQRAFREATHLRVSYDTRRGFIDDLLESAGIQRRVALSLSHFSGIITTLKNNPLLATLPDYAAVALAQASGLTTARVPLATPNFTTSMIWRAEHDGAAHHRWLRETLSRFTPPVRRN